MLTLLPYVEKRCPYKYLRPFIISLWVYLYLAHLRWMETANFDVKSEIDLIDLVGPVTFACCLSTTGNFGNVKH